MKKLLVIDDKEDNLIALSALLKNLMPGCAVLTAQSGFKGIKKAGDELPDVILLDVEMPDLDGFETCRRLKNDESTKAIPVIMITAIKTDARSRIKVLEIGADAFLSKPIDEAELLSQVKVALRAKNAEDALREERNSLEKKVLERTADLHQEITVRRRAERALEESEAKIRSILDNIGIGVGLISPEMRVLDLNRQMREWFPNVDPGQRPICYQSFNDPPREEMCDTCPTRKTLQDGLVHEATIQTPRADLVLNYRIVASPIFNALGEVTAAIEMVEDITEKLSLESQIRQAQKMEAVGLLAGGVAHDFNNMLGVILGYAEMALGKVDPAQPLHDDLLEIMNAARRSAAITRQLLAFARKQTIAPQVLDLNETVEGMLKMLRRLIGEDINLVWQPGSGLWPVKMDPSQVEQLLANLCVNARDAVARIGKVTIETGNVAFDQGYCADHSGFVPGEYALLAVSDDGCGMDKETLARIFEPFFTTKEVGQGTGLGLATVYGIVKQNNGFINVYSEPGKGTTFKIYLSRQEAQNVKPQKESEEEISPSRGETVLVVEDEVSLLKLAGETLANLGYTVLTADAPGEALRLGEEYTEEIHLLMTDVILPDMNGRDLAEKLKEIRPTLKCLFMSGYTADVIAHRGMLEEGVQFISKPFSARELAAKIRKTLEEGRGTGTIVERSRPASPKAVKSTAPHGQPVRSTPLPTRLIGVRPARLMKRKSRALPKGTMALRVQCQGNLAFPHLFPLTEWRRRDSTSYQI